MMRRMVDPVGRFPAVLDFEANQVIGVAEIVDEYSVNVEESGCEIDWPWMMISEDIGTVA